MVNNPTRRMTMRFLKMMMFILAAVAFFIVATGCGSEDGTSTAPPEPPDSYAAAELDSCSGEGEAQCCKYKSSGCIYTLCNTGNGESYVEQEENRVTSLGASCEPCTYDSDCYYEGDVCAENVCARTCADDGDCFSDNQCIERSPVTSYCG